MSGPECETSLAAAVRQFNAGDYFECHETLEELWLGERGELRHLYQGILQIGVGLLHLQRGNAAGARSLLQRGAGLVEPFAPVACGLDLSRLLAASNRILFALLEEGAAAAGRLLAAAPPRLEPGRGGEPRARPLTSAGR